MEVSFPTKHINSDLTTNSWDLVGLGPFDEVVSDVIAHEATSGMPWGEKIPQLGTISMMLN